MRPSHLLALAAAGALSAAVPAMAEVPLIPRTILFGNPERAGLQVSPDGRWISFTAPLDGVMNVFVQPIEGGETKPLTRSVDRPIRMYFWSYDSRHVLYMQDSGGDENFHLFRTSIDGGEAVDLTPVDGARVAGVELHRDRPGHALIQINDRDPAAFDMQRLDLATGERTLVFTNDAGYAAVIQDDAWVPRATLSMTADGGVQVRMRDGAEGEWYDFLDIPMEDAMNTSPVGFTADGRTFYMIDATDRDTSALVEMEPRAGGHADRRVVHANDRADVGGSIVHPVTGRVQAVAVNYLRNEWTVIDESIRRDLAALAKLEDGDVRITGRTLDDSIWTVAFVVDDGPVRYWIWDRAKQEGRLLFTNQPELESYDLARMQPVEIAARDGLLLPSYLTVPVDRKPNERVPMVLFVHGGPWARDSWGLNPYHQWLANRGYAVLSVNFRGSTGFGKRFVNAGNREWYGAMQDDLVDAVRWAVSQGIADADRIAIMGGSYGGYATLAGLTRDADLFACGVDIVGPSHIRTLLQTIPPYWKPMLSMFESRVGSLGETEFLDAISPLTHAERIEDPLLIGQGANDPRVKISESDQIVAAMHANDIPVTYVVFPDEGHGFARPTNNMAFNAVTEAFLARHLGGRVEPIVGEIASSTAQVRSLGELELPGVELWTPPAPDDKEAAAPTATDVRLEDLPENQRKQLEAILRQLEQVTPEMIPLVINQMEQQRELVPDDQKAMFEYLLKVLRERGGGG